MLCPRCGFSVRAGATTCQTCGKLLEGETEIRIKGLSTPCKAVPNEDPGRTDDMDSVEETVGEADKPVYKPTYKSTSGGTARYCKYCGSGIRENARFCGKCGKSVQDDAKCFCGKCGKQVKRSAKFCPNCGSAMPQKS